MTAGGFGKVTWQGCYAVLLRTSDFDAFDSPSRRKTNIVNNPETRIAFPLGSRVRLRAARSVDVAEEKKQRRLHAGKSSSKGITMWACTILAGQKVKPCRAYMHRHLSVFISALRISHGAVQLFLGSRTCKEPPSVFMSAFSSPKQKKAY